MDYKKIDNIEVDGIDTTDYPDFCDAYIESAYHVDGDALTDDELEALLDDDKTMSFVNAQIHEHQLYL